MATSWSSNYSACQATNVLTASSHIITENLIQCGCPTPTTHPPSDPSASLTSATRAKLELLRAQVHGWTPCTKDPAAPVADPFANMLQSNVATCQSLRKSWQRSNYVAINGCYPGYYPSIDYQWHTCGYAGDQVSNSMINCLAGDKDRCSDIIDSMDPATGYTYRNPFARRHPETNGGNPAFSRDQMDGLLGYFVMNHDKANFIKFLTSVKNTPKWNGLFNICPPRPNIPKPWQTSQADWDAALPDDRCGLIPETAGMVYFAAMTAGLTQADINAIGTDLYSALASGSMTTDATALTESITAPALGTAGYLLSDTADGTYLRMNTTGGMNPTVKSAASNIDIRTSQLNPYYHFLAESLQPTEWGGYLIQKYCKGTRPTWGLQFTSGNGSIWNNSSGRWDYGQPIGEEGYQYMGGYNPYGNFMTPAGHDCLAWLDMYLGNGNHTETQCKPGDTVVNGACLKFAFNKPALAPLPGLGYQFDPSSGAITYEAMDLNQCNYGGSFVVGSNPPRCSFPSGISGVNPAGSYSVDQTPAWPGVYYPQVNHGCPYGGSPAGPNCQLHGFAAPTIFPGVSYTVDTSPSWPGVYYAQVDGACPYGGVVAGPNCEIKGFASGVLDTSVQYFVRENPAHPGVYYYPVPVAERLGPHPHPIFIPSTL